ncbi:uncharacterized protein BcabD6B2_36660 [Babesia caballi]|uniref:CLASP N-terminal domain-containing protein n=1 Tax=Babesia caballi TaxID=5871 RepID=A0AAV4LVM4_BABCB|nr:hypothetical protein, conserved [Babesia caballi]
MTGCCCFKPAKAAKDESPLIDLRNPVLTEKEAQVPSATVETETEKRDIVKEQVIPAAQTSSPVIKPAKRDIYPTKPKQIRIVSNFDDERPISRANKVPLKSWWEENEPIEVDLSGRANSRRASREGEHTSSNAAKRYDSVKPTTDRETVKLRTPGFSGASRDKLQPINGFDGENIGDSRKVVERAVFKQSSNGNRLTNTSSGLKEGSFAFPTGHGGTEGTDNENLDATDHLSPDTVHNVNGYSHSIKTASKDRIRERSQTAEDNEWGLDGDDHVEIDSKYEYTSPKMSINVDSVLDEIPEFGGKSMSHQNRSNDNSVAGATTSDLPEDSGKLNSLNDADFQTDTAVSEGQLSWGQQQAKPVIPKVRPLPLRRGTTKTPLRRKAAAAKPTVATVMKLLDKLVTLDDSKWKELTSCHTEISAIVKDHGDLIAECDSSALMGAVRSITSHANNARSNLSNSGLQCLGNFYKGQGALLGQPLAEVLDVCVRKAASGSPEFICASANAALVKICLASSETKLCSILVKLYKTNKSAQLTILNCMCIVMDNTGPTVVKLKLLPDVVEIALDSLRTGSIEVRRAGKILMGVINEHEDVETLLNKMRKGDDVRRLASTSLKRFKEEEKIKYLEQLMSVATR